MYRGKKGGAKAIIGARRMPPSGDASVLFKKKKRICRISAVGTQWRRMKCERLLSSDPVTASSFEYANESARIIKAPSSCSHPARAASRSVAKGTPGPGRDQDSVWCRHLLLSFFRCLSNSWQIWRRQIGPVFALWKKKQVFSFISIYTGVEI